jgi:hypothetical protein
MPREPEPSLIEARERGAKRYVSALQCSKGHQPPLERFTVSTSCCVCAGVKGPERSKKPKPNQQQVAAIRKADDARVPTPRKALARALQDYACNPGARERSDYLDQLIRKIVR